jgi:peptidoglycan/LPS O-acetylase OafA/YrhL
MSGQSLKNEAIEMSNSRLDGGKNVARGIAALLVCFAHAYGLFLYPHFGGDTITSHFFGLAAHQSVMVFFAISGFLITKSIIANSKRNDRFSLRDYLFARVARIYPPLVFSVLLTCVFYAVVRGLVLAGSSAELPYSVGSFPQSREFFSVTLEDIWYALKMNNGMLLANGPLWSLCVEWWIYIVIGLAVNVFSARGLLQRLLWMGALGLAASKFYSVNANALFHLGVWAIGCVMSITNHQVGLFAKRQSAVICSLLMVICMLAWLKPELILAGGRHFSWSANAVQFVICAFWCSLILPDRHSKETMIGLPRLN